MADVLTDPKTGMPKARILLHRAQARFLDSQATFRGFVGGIASGKSFVGAYDLIKRAKPGRLYMVVAPTYVMLQDASLRSFMTVAEGAGALAGAFRRGDMAADLNNGAEVLFRSADNPDRMRGPNLSGIWLDEASVMKDEAFDIGIGRLRQGGEMGWASATFTPKGKQHWTYKVFGPDPHTGQQRPNTFLVHCKTGDNPFLPPQFDETLRGKYAPVMREQELGGEFLDPAGALIKKAWLRYYTKRGDYYLLPVQGGGTHAVGGPGHTRRFSTVDLACSLKETADYTVIATWDIIPGPNLMLVDVQRERMEAPDIPRALLGVWRRYRPAYFVIETVASWLSVVQLARREGLPVREAKPDGDKVTHSLAAQARLEAGQVWLPEPGPSCPWLADFEAELLSFPEGEHDDQVDCLSYAVDTLDMMYVQGTGAGAGFISGKGMGAV